MFPVVNGWAPELDLAAEGLKWRRVSQNTLSFALPLRG